MPADSASAKSDVLALPFLEKSGRSAELIRTHDWKATSLGEPKFWPQSLKTALGIVLGSGQACNLIWGKDLVTFYNDAYRPLLGVIPDGIGSSFPSFRQDIWPYVENEISAGFRGDSNTVENIKVVTQRHGEPEEAYFTLNYSPVYDESGAVSGVLSFLLETTQTVLAHQALEDENSLLRRALDHLPQMVWSTLPDGSHDFFNAPWYAFTGVEKGSTDGERWNELFHPDDRERAWTIWRHSLRTGKPYEIQYRLKHRDGDYRWTLGRALAERDGEGKIVRWYGTCTDIHEHLIAQEKVKQLQSAMVHLSRISAMGTMASTLAHELNQPLAAISNYAGAAQRMVGQGSHITDFGEPLAGIERNALRAGKIISRLRALTQKGGVRSHSFCADDIIKEAGELAKVGFSDLRLRYELQDGRLVMGDPIQIQQVIINLIRNAAEAIPEGTERDVLLVSRASNEDTLISVEDRGSGIPRGNIATVFEAFFTTKDQGTGIGLSISRTIIEAHGGRIWAENRPGGGSRFSFTLPIAAFDASGEPLDQQQV